MIGNPVSMPRVVRLVERYRRAAGAPEAFQVCQVTEQEIMDAMLTANRNGHIVCTQGGECVAAFKKMVAQGRIERNRLGVLDATAHALKFAVFQDMYFADSFPPDFGIRAREDLRNRPVSLAVPEGVPTPAPGAPLSAPAMREFVEAAARGVAAILGIGGK